MAPWNHDKRTPEEEAALRALYRRARAYAEQRIFDPEEAKIVERAYIAGARSVKRIELPPLPPRFVAEVVCCDEESVTVKIFDRAKSDA